MNAFTSNNGIGKSLKSSTSSPLKNNCVMKRAPYLIPWLPNDRSFWNTQCLFSIKFTAPEMHLAYRVARPTFAVMDGNR